MDLIDANNLINRRAETLIAQSVRVRAAVSATMEAVNGIRKRLQKLTRRRGASKALAAPAAADRHRAPDDDGAKVAVVDVVVRM